MGIAMRSRERLIEVCDTINPSIYPFEAFQFQCAVAEVRLVKRLSIYSRHFLRRIVDRNSSPHLRELAEQMIDRFGYVTKDK